MYKILIKDTKNAGLYRFLTVKQERNINLRQLFP